MSIDSAARAYSTPAPLTDHTIEHDSPVTCGETIELGQQVIASEARALVHLLGRVDEQFYDAVEIVRTLRGSLIVTGIGKAGWIGQKLAATFASTGCRAHFLHPTEAFHGDLGRVGSDDVVLALSQSGETSEMLQLLPALRSQGTALIAVTATPASTLGRAADVVLPLGRLDEACSLGLAPSSSTTAMLALGDALALVVSRLKGFQPEDFARFHPGGALGLKLSSVDAHMRTLGECRVANETQTVRQVLAASTRPGRRSGAVLLTDADGRLTGIFTDSDLARMIERRNDAALDAPILRQMVRTPTTIRTGARMSEAIELLADRKISELPVVDVDGSPLGLIDVTDVVGLMPEPTEAVDVDDEPITMRLFPRREAPETD